MRVLKEPLFHFFLIGAAIFVWFHIVAPENEVIEDLGVIAIGKNDVALLGSQFEARWKRRPSDVELQSLIDASIREEVLVREARKLGLDRGDAVIRSRLRQKMDFLTEAIATSVLPEDEELEEFLQQNLDQYTRPPRVAFTQIFLGEEPAETEIEQALAALRSGQELSGLHGSTLLPKAMQLTATRVVDSTFGGGFAFALTQLETGRWSGPIRSGYGIHLVQVSAIEPSQSPPLSEIREVVLRDWRRNMAEDLARAQYETLVDHYQITAPDLSGLTK